MQIKITQEEIKEARTKFVKESCCQSYKTPKGRCFTCPDWKKANFGEEE
ncbi:hypothetical protein HOA92_02990 [archaeon]|jgi:hypothetical protein|nr:hypothetical protein [archaeon]MBT6761981.1 hypothetical protein [archaeon]